MEVPAEGITENTLKTFFMKKIHGSILVICIVIMPDYAIKYGSLKRRKNDCR